MEDEKVRKDLRLNQISNLRTLMWGAPLIDVIYFITSSTDSRFSLYVELINKNLFITASNTSNTSNNAESARQFYEEHPE